MLRFWFKEFPQYPCDHTDYWRTRLISYALLVTTSYFLLLTIINIVTFSNFSLALLDGTGLLFSLGIFAWFRATGNVTVASWAVTIMVTALILLFVTSAKGYSHSLYWATLVPPFAFFLLGRKFGTAVSTFTFFICVLVVYKQMETQQPGYFAFGSLLNVIEVSVAHILLFRFYEQARSSAYNTLAIRNTEILQLAETDKLTGLFNREKLESTLITLLSKVDEQHPLSVMLLDVDHFKKINDQYGHFEGDKVLRVLAKKLQELMREEDVVARWGGEEFVVLCATTSLEKAMQLAQRIREDIAKQVISGHALTISVGVAQYVPSDSLDSLLGRADVGLYQAKNNGRNSVIAA
ncbi:Diguanylate cyclase DgcM [Paraglaciecola mesophila]|uniref:diguanylate cyclase n=1 Tax=Paraglaciecola mesophila TaxID=197222 RepID=A0A857JHT5_9ALTE|nr:GGDEF domain-containing protein [Paraglaciecola mesophila]QHJ10862.1 Diguanylate cyclase DgcM [Paraglaciecola mesophila]